jgi:E3 ubiquitin-protein ligase listerin
MVKKKASTPASAIRVADSPFSRSVSSSPFGSSAGLFSSISPLSFAQPPPDYSAISEPSVVVSFKSLLKQSEVTKRKAVDDILALAEEHLKAEKPLDDGIVQAWVRPFITKRGKG